MNTENKVENIVFSNKKEIGKRISLLIAFLSISIMSAFFIIPSDSNAFGELSNIEVRLVPENPGEREEVTVNISSFSFDVNSAEISVFINGVLKQQKIGIKTFVFNTGNFGEKSVVKIIAKKINGLQVVKEISVVPSSVDLVYELVDPYRPFGYLGKSLALSNSTLAIYAFPNLINSSGKRVAKDSLVYTWYKNGDIDLDKSGFSKSSYSIDRLDAFPRETVITVRVATLDGSLETNGKIVFNPEGSQVEFYLLDPALPFAFRNIANPDIFSSYADTEILAVPYFMDGIRNGKSKYKWSIGGKLYNHPKNKNKNKILLVNNSNDNFVKKIVMNLQIVDRKKVLQAFEKSFSVIFSEPKSNEGNKKFFNTGKVKEEAGFFGF